MCVFTCVYVLDMELEFSGPDIRRAGIEYSGLLARARTQAL